MTPQQDSSDGGGSLTAPSSPGTPPVENNSNLVGERIDDGKDESAGVPSPPQDTRRPPLSPLVHSRNRSAESRISDVTFDAAQKGFSWDSQNVADEIDQVSREGQEEDAQSSSAKLRRSPIMTLSQLNRTCPVEEEAEKLILKALDEKKERPKMGSSILPQVPDNSAAAFEAPTPSSTTHSDSETSHVQLTANHEAPSLHTSVPSSHSINEPCSETSAPRSRWMTRFMRVIHRKPLDNAHQSHETSRLVSTTVPEQDIPPTSDADALVQNANILFRHSTNRKRDPSDGSGDIEQGSSQNDSDPTGKNRKKNPNEEMKRLAKQAGRDVKNEVNVFGDFVQPRKTSIGKTITNELLYLIFPLLIVATILYYGTRNPELGNTGASISWFLLFLLRSVIAYTLGKATSVYVIDYLSLRRRFTVKLLGPIIALLIVQSKGYPSEIFFWGVWSAILLCGKGAFAKHWLYWQEAIDMCNANNPAGTITESGLYVSVVGCAVLFGAAVAAKRLWLGLYIGKRTYISYDDKFAKTKKDRTLVSEIANLSQHTDALEAHEAVADVDTRQSFHTGDSSQPDDISDASSATGNSDYQYDGLSSSQREVIRQHLEAWEEPDATKKKPTDVSIGEILQFRHSLDMVDDKYPFTVAFGLADKRETCFESAQKVYYRLLLRQNSGDVLHFNTIAVVALNHDGTMDQENMKELVHLFRPNRQGELSEVDFLKSIDSLYKEFRLLQATMDNSGAVSRSFEIMVNYAFYIVLWCIMFFIVGLDPLSLFVSLSSFIVGFAFMIGSASSKFFEGILFILVRGPYDIGDRINVSDVEKDTDANGSTTWFVEDLSLYSTTVRLALTNEVATYSNGSLANSRVINAARSPQAIVAIYLKFSVGVSYEKIELCRKTIQKFVKDRPREWISLQSFRADNVEQDQGYVRYKVQLQHREAWQNLNSILNSKAEVTSFSLEVAKQLGMRYVAPPLPVDLQMSSDRDSKKADTDAGNQGVAAASDGFSVSPALRAQIQQQQQDQNK